MLSESHVLKTLKTIQAPQNIVLDILVVVTVTVTVMVTVTVTVMIDVFRFLIG
jgi:hypothetical protein